MKAGLFGGLVLWSFIALYLTGCGGATGWQFNIGVTPVTAIDHHETLTPKVQQAKY